MNDAKDGVTQRELDLMLKNESVWREFMVRKMEKFEKEQNEMVVTMTTLKIKIGFISGIFGAVAGFIGPLLTKKLGG